MFVKHNAPDNGQFQDHKDKYFDTSKNTRNDYVQYGSSSILFSEVMTNVNILFKIGHKSRSKD